MKRIPQPVKVIKSSFTEPTLRSQVLGNLTSTHWHGVRLRYHKSLLRLLLLLWRNWVVAGHLLARGHRHLTNLRVDLWPITTLTHTYTVSHWYFITAINVNVSYWSNLCWLLLLNDFSQSVNKSRLIVWYKTQISLLISSVEQDKDFNFASCIIRNTSEMNTASLKCITKLPHTFLKEDLQNQNSSL